MIIIKLNLLVIMPKINHQSSYQSRFAYTLVSIAHESLVTIRVYNLFLAVECLVRIYLATVTLMLMLDRVEGIAHSINFIESYIKDTHQE